MQFKKLLAAAAIGAAFIGGSLATTPALAQHYHGGYGGGYHGGYYGGYHGYYGGWHGGWGHGYWGPGIGFYFGPGFYPGDYWAGAYYPGYAGYPYVVADAGPQTYVEQNQQQAQPQAQSYSWYRCDSANGTYYPYVKTCPGGWTKVAPSTPQ
jgi:hypothetical protein